MFPPNLRMRDVVGIFTKPVVFEYAVFELGVDFSECEFQADVDFFGSTFKGAEGYVGCANFTSCRFGAEASFWAAKFQGGGDSNCGAVFNKTVFNGPARFNAASFDNWTTFTDARFQSKAAFADATFKGRTDFSSVTFAAEAGDFFVGEMEMQRLDVGATRGTWRWCARNLSLLALYKYVALYGESYRRLFSWGAILILAFAALRLQRVPSPGQVDVATALGRSVAAFFQLPVTNTGLDVAERLLSAPILGLLLVSLKRTFERK